MSAAARLAGVSVETFATACERGELPIKLHRLGDRGLRYIVTAELMKFLGRHPSPAASRLERAP